MYRGVPKVLFQPPIDSAALEMQVGWGCFCCNDLPDKLPVGKVTLILPFPMEVRDNHYC